MSLFLERHGTLLLAHRGASAYAPENTLSAFHLTLAQLRELDAEASFNPRFTGDAFLAGWLASISSPPSKIG